MGTKSHPKTVRKQVTNRKLMPLILKADPPIQRCIASKLERVITPHSLRNTGIKEGTYIPRTYGSNYPVETFVIDNTIGDNPICDAASNVATAMVSELRVHAAANACELFVKTPVVLQTTLFSTRDSGVAAISIKVLRDLELFLETGSAGRRPGQGRRWATTPNEDRYLVLMARRHLNMNATFLQQHLRSATGTTRSDLRLSETGSMV
ncbi:transposable element Tcb2 transposase [Trichonephila clavipes]|nr:transposable element Tcb2 transposase [Trichonephila clavipes]